VHRSRRLLACVLVLAGIGTASLWWVEREKVTFPVKKGGFECPSPRKGPPSFARPAREMEQSPPRAGASKRIPLPCGVIHSFPLPLEATESQTVELSQEDLDVAAEVVDPQGDLLLEVDGVGNRGSELVPIFAMMNGVYRVKVSSSGCPGDGAYVMKVGVPRVATAEDRKRHEAAASYFLGKELERAGSRLAEIEEELRKAALLWDEGGYLKGQADAFYKLGKIQAGGFRWTASRDSFLRALPLYHALGDLSLEAVVLNDIGLACERLAKIECARSFYQKALGPAEATGDQDLLGTILRNLGMLESRRGESGQALKLLGQALDVAPKGGSTRLSILNALGAVYARVGEVEPALRYHRRVLRQLASSSDGEQLGVTMTHLGDAYRYRDDPNQAVNRYLCALKLSREAGDLRNTAITFNNLGLVYSTLRRWPEASDAYQNARRIFVEQQDSLAAAVALINDAWIRTARGQYQEALRLYQSARDPIEASQQLPPQAAIYFGMAWTEYRLRNLRQARADVEEAIAIVESIRSKADRSELRASYLAGRQNFYELLVEVLMELDRLQPAEDFEVEAFLASNKARSRALLDALEDQPVLPSLTLEEVQRELLDENTILLEYFLGDRRSYLWVVTPTSIASYPLASKEMIEGLAGQFYEAIARSGTSMRRQAIRKAEALSRALLGQVAGRLGRKRLLIVVPSALQKVPFNALPDPSAPPAESREEWPEPLVVHHEIVRLPSVSVLASLRRLRSKQKVPGGRVAILADAVFSLDDERLEGLALPTQQGEPDGDGLRRLLNSRREADAIEKAAGPRRVRKVLGFEATRDLVVRGELSDFDILHFSTHGTLDTEFPGRSALELSHYNESGHSIEGSLRAEDIAHLDLPAGLVVLSACSTGLGKELRGEGLVGLTQAFFTAGASRVMVSLWKIDDRATAELMERFYSNLLGKGLPPAAALREAQVWAWKNGKNQSPFSWAGFVLQGEAR
jgi:CHAT domain-containing protein